MEIIVVIVLIEYIYLDDTGQLNISFFFFLCKDKKGVAIDVK